MHTRKHVSAASTRVYIRTRSRSVYLSHPRLPPLLQKISACLREIDLVGDASSTTRHIFELRPRMVGVSLREMSASQKAARRVPERGSGFRKQTLGATRNLVPIHRYVVDR